MTIPRDGRLLNLRNYRNKPLPPNTVVIDRTGKWGNPYVINVHGNREECVEKYRMDIMEDEEMQENVKMELTGKTLACWCAPKLCHGHVLLEIIDGEWNDR